MKNNPKKRHSQPIVTSPIFRTTISQLVLESENEHNLKLIQELAEKLNIHCRFIVQKVKADSTKYDEINDAIQFVKTFSQEETSFGDALTWQKNERQECP